MNERRKRQRRQDERRKVSAPVATDRRIRSARAARRSGQERRSYVFNYYHMELRK